MNVQVQVPDQPGGAGAATWNVQVMEGRVDTPSITALHDTDQDPSDVGDPLTTPAGDADRPGGKPPAA